MSEDNREALKEMFIKFLEWIPEFSKPSDYAELTGWPYEDAKTGDGSNFISESFSICNIGERRRKGIVGIGIPIDTVGWI